MNLLFIALAPILIIAFYIYFRDKYEKEPVYLLLISLVLGGLIVMPIIYLERFLSLFSIYFDGYSSAAYNAFAVASFSEESFKFLALFILIWRNRNFNEKFDGIVYAVFISLGFAAVENVLYVSEGGLSVGLMRAITAVPAHALFGIIMGYYYGLAKFYPKQRTKYLLQSYFMPILFHGLYDFILMSEHPYLLVVFIPFIIFLWRRGFKRMKTLSY